MGINIGNSNHFKKDLNILFPRLTVGCGEDVVEKIAHQKDRLIELREQTKGELKINHSVMELVCAAYLIKLGHDVEVEHNLNGRLTCDLYWGTNIVEIETGFVPPENALKPTASCRAKVASKIVRYSPLSKEFALGTPPNNILEIPKVFIKPPKLRRPEEVKAVCELCAPYYTNPPITFEDVMNGRVHTVYVIDVDNFTVRKFGAANYRERYQPI